MEELLEVREKPGMCCYGSQGRDASRSVQAMGHSGEKNCPLNSSKNEVVLVPTLKCQKISIISDTDCSELKEAKVKCSFMKSGFKCKPAGHSWKGIREEFSLCSQVRTDQRMFKCSEREQVEREQ